MAFKWQEALSTSKTGKATNEYFIREHILEKNPDVTPFGIINIFFK